MPARVSIESLAILDELESRARRSAGRLAALADAARDEGRASPDELASLGEASRSLSEFIPELASTAERLPRPEAGSADGRAGGEAEEADEDLARIGSGALLARAHALVASGGAEAVARARSIWELISEERLDPTGAPAGEGGATDPAAAAGWVRLSAGLWAAEGRARYLDALERAYYNALLFAQTDDGAGVVGRTLDGGPGEADDAVATPALAGALATVARHVLTTRPEETGGNRALVSGIAANATAVLCVDGRSWLRLVVQTQIPVRGWTSWTFEPIKEAKDTAPSSTVTRRTARRQRAAVLKAGPSESTRKDAGAGTFTFRVRVPKWAVASQEKADGERGRERADAAGSAAPSGRRGAAGSTASSGRRGAGVKIDGRPANVRCEEGFYQFEVPADRETKIEVVLDIGPWTLERESPVSWGSELAAGYGPLLLTAPSRVNPGEDLSVPLKVVSQADALELLGDIRRRLPLVRAKALGGARAGPVLLVPVSETGGFVEGIGGRRPVRCQEFRTWHRRGR